MSIVAIERKANLTNPQAGQMLTDADDWLDFFVGALVLALFGETL